MKSVDMYNLPDLEEIVRLARKASMPVTLTYTSDNTSGQFPRRQSVIQTMDGRVIVQDFDFESKAPAGLLKQKDDRPSVAVIMSSPEFLAACAKAGIEPTRRQTQKYRNGEGKAFKAKDRPDPLPEGRAKRAWDNEEV